MSSPNRTRSMARTLSPLALHDALPDPSGLLAPSPTPDGTPCTCSVCCMFLTPARDFSLPHLSGPRSVRTAHIPERDRMACTHARQQSASGVTPAPMAAPWPSSRRVALCDDWDRVALRTRLP